METHGTAPVKANPLSESAQAMAKTDLPRPKIGEALGILAQGNVKTIVSALHAGWGDAAERREVLMGAAKHIDLAEAVITMEMGDVNWDDLKKYLLKGEDFDNTTAAQILLRIQDKIVRKSDWKGLVQSLLNNKPELERTDTTSELFVGLITAAVRSHYAARGEIDTESDVLFLESLVEKLTTGLQAEIERLKPKKNE